MCYYNGQKVSRAEYIQLLQLEKAVAKYDFLNKDIHDGFAYGPIAVLKPNEAKDNFDIVQMEWGFLPKYLKDREAVEKFRRGYKNEKTGKWITGYTTLNAKAENLFENEERNGVSMYAEAAKERRCLVLSTGFFEWRHIFPANKRTGLPVKTAVKYPYYISLKDEEYFFFAGIYQEWTDKTTGETVETVAVTTAPANELMTQVHNSKMRMPTILNPDLAWEWMMEDLTEDRITEIAKTQYQSDKMQACTITKDFKESLSPAEPFEYEDLPALEFNI